MNPYIRQPERPLERKWEVAYHREESDPHAHDFRITVTGENGSSLLLRMTWAEFDALQQAMYALYDKVENAESQES